MQRANEAQEVIENVFGLAPGSLMFGSMSSSREAWSMIIDLKNPSGFVEGHDKFEGPDDPNGIKTPDLKLEADGVVYNTYTSYHIPSKSRHEVWVKVYPDDHFNHQVFVPTSAYLVPC